ncbi:MAG: hypothetical protein HC849_27700 [Oscillatoriales cyanobacterium RU_3_3]|nr:hypothetical protein [Oscillatoriales cyanobacterium RU_3_3]NJR25349.1 hypothetical protein [Richelia sp. CSU_2_1]
MLAYKLKGKIDATGNLVIVEPVNMPPGDVEIIVLQLAVPVKGASDSESAILFEGFANEPETPKKLRSKVKAFQGLFDRVPVPEPMDFDDPDKQAKWEYLKEKHNL